MYSSFDNLDSFPLTINNKKFTSRDLILICIGCRSKFACSIFIGVLFLKPTLAMSLCASVYMCFVVTCWERADLLALVCGVYCDSVTFRVRFGT